MIGATVSLAVRARIARKQLFQEFPGSVPERFHENGASGRSLKNLATRFGGASRCLEVIVTDEELWVRLGSPFSFLFSGAEYDLMHRIPISRIHTVKPLQNWTGRPIEIEFTDSAGELHRLQLTLKKRDEFLTVLPPRAEAREASLLRPACPGEAVETLLRSTNVSPGASTDELLRPDDQ